MILRLQSRLAEATRDAVRAAYGAELPSVTFQYPPRLEMGDLALTAPFDLARTLRQKPRDIAGRLAEALASAPAVRKAEVAGGGYVNLFLRRDAVAREMYDMLRDPLPPAQRPAAVLVEHTSINPNKAAHIGHLRNAALGDTFVRVLAHRGYDVSVQNYIDDTGVQVADVVVGLIHLERKDLDDVAAMDRRFDYYCWDLYARMADFYAADPARKDLQAATLHDIEAGNTLAARMAEHVASRIVESHLATMERLGIRYELLVHESDILRLEFWERAFELLKSSGALQLETEGKNAGCWVLRMGSEAEAEERRIDEDDKVIVRSNRLVTYTGKDIAYQLWKLGLLGRDFHYRRYRTYRDAHVLWSTTSGGGEIGAPAFGGADEVYNVIDVGQSYPQRVVRAGVAAIAPEAAARSHHLGYEKVVLSPETARSLGYDVTEDEAAVKVSGRRGLGVKADDLLDVLEKKARAEVESRDPGREATARDRTVRAIAVGALRYFMLKFSRGKIITFDMDEALAFVGETGPYIQNAVVRARNIFAKMESEGHRVEDLLRRAAALDLARLLSGEEGDEIWSLMMLMARSEEVAEQVVRSEETALLAKHTFALAQAFHAYYQKPAYSVLYAASDELRALRTLVVDAFLRQMDVLTGLLGIPVPERM
ncbi:MAG TPA: arginine--tRNA ligase [Vicinamibacteria bacterium]|nr:arginine--tRNA ligase [Vicinamibacteria bacterium]